MNDNHVSQLVATLEGAYPQSKISPSKVLATWQASKRLQAFNNALRGDLINHILRTCKYFPSLPEVIDACDQLEPREKPGPCAACDDQGHIFHGPDGQDLQREHTVTYNNAPVTFQYQGKPILYAYVEPCPICNPKGRS